MIDLSNYSCDKCKREGSWHCKHCWHTADKPPTRFKRKKKTGCETPTYSRFSMVPNPNLGYQPTKSSDTKPPKPPTSGSNAVKPNQNYVPPASVAKTHTMVCHMKLEDLKDWVKTKAQIGDVAHCHDHMLDRDYIYCYRKPDDNPFWVAMDPYFLEKYFKKENKGDKEVLGTINCNYETPCGWCTKWDKKCDRKIGCSNDNKPPRGLRAKCSFIEDSVDASVEISGLYMSTLESAPVDPKSTVLENKLD